MIGARKTKLGKEKSIGYGYVGKWDDSTLGWSLPEYLSNEPFMELNTRNRIWSEGEMHYLCKITVELVRDSRGRRIGKRQPKEAQR